MKVLMRQTEYQNPQLHRKFMSKTASEKLTALFANEKLLKIEVSKGEYSRKERLRMITITQSYNITDSLDYVKARRMKRIIEKERMIKEAQEAKQAE